MIKDLIAHLGYSFFGNISLVMFLTLFVVVTVYALRASREETERNAHLVLEDSENYLA